MKSESPNLINRNWDIVGPYLHCNADYGDARVFHCDGRRVLARCQEEAKAAISKPEQPKEDNYLL